MAISDFRNFWLLTLKNQNFDFSQNKRQQNWKCWGYKNGMYTIELCAINSCTKFQANIFIFGYAMGNGQVRVMTWPYENRLLEFLSYDKTSDIFGILRQNWTRQMFLKENFDFQNVTFFTWTWPDLRTNVKMSVTIEFYVPNGPYNMSHTTLVLFFHAATSFNLILTLTCA